MKKSILLSLAFVTLLGQSPSAFSKNEVLNKNSQLVRDVYSGVKFNYFDKNDRLIILKDFLQVVELEYALLPLKKERIGLDFEKIKSEAIAKEEVINDIMISSADRKDELKLENIIYLQAKSNMEFLDRMQKLVAEFKDTHFGLQEKISRPFLYNGVRLFRIQGKIIVGSLENKLLALVSKMTGNDFSSIKVGDEVLEIDGQPVEKVIASLKPYLSGSSEEFIDSQAVRSLTIRNFKYDEKNFQRILFKNAGLIKLPFFANRPGDATPRLDAITFFNKHKIPSDGSAIGLTFDKSTNKWTDSSLTFDGYSTRRLHLNLKGLTEFVGDDGSPAIRTGYYINKGKSYGVLQILTFYTKNAKQGNTTIPFLDAIRNFVIEMKENELPLILDLRVNGGGNGSYPARVLSMLAEEGVIYPGATSGFRMTHYMRQVQEPGLFQEVVGEDQSFGLTIDELQSVIANTLEQRKEYTPMFTTEVIPFDPKVKGFKNKIVALVTADCISACDKMAFLLKSSKRATIIGTHTNGTGAGYLSTGELNTKWEDPLRVFSSTIPNYLFGLPGKNFETTVFEEESVSTMCTENKPTIADVPYSPTMVDVARNNLGWLQKASQVLEQP
jgi:C-terminal processing protease CtpA/Prc